jgi:hypothetical protein
MSNKEKWITLNDCQIEEFGIVTYDSYDEKDCIDFIESYKSYFGDYQSHGFETIEVLQSEVEHWEYKLKKIQETESMLKKIKTLTKL